MFDLVLNQRYNIDIPGLIGNVGVNNICNLLIASIDKNATKGTDDYKYKNAKIYNWSRVSIFPDDWIWHFTVTGKGKYVGSITRRISKYIWEQYGYHLVEAELNAIGELARTNCAPAQSVSFDFIDKFNWHAGDFGDHGSCYFSYNSMARVLMRDNGGLAVRIYADANNNYGAARAWLAIPDTHKCGNFAVVFNGTGNDYRNKNTFDYSTVWFARLLATFWGLDYKKTNNFIGNNLLYGNASIVGKYDDIINVNNINLEWSNEYYRNGEMQCRSCDFSSANENNFTIINCKRFCKNCLNKKCCSCKTPKQISDLFYKNSHYYCQPCKVKFGL